MKYVVLVVGMSLKNNKIAEGTDIVEDEQLATPAETLIKGGFIKKATKSDIESYNEKLARKNGTKVPEEEVVPVNYSKMKSEELIAELQKRNIEFKETDKVSDFVKLLEENDKDLS